MSRAVLSVVLITAAMALATATGCGPNQRIMNSAADTPQPPSEPAGPPTLDDDLQAMRTADFRFIYVFRRKDGQAMTDEDRTFLNSYKPSEVNRARVSDEGRAVIFGSNFKLPRESIKPLSERFVLEDLSTPAPDSEPDADASPQSQ